MVIYCFTNTKCARLNVHELPRTDIQGLAATFPSHPTSLARRHESISLRRIKDPHQAWRPQDAGGLAVTRRFAGRRPFSRNRGRASSALAFQPSQYEQQPLAWGAGRQPARGLPILRCSASTFLFNGNDVAIYSVSTTRRYATTPIHGVNINKNRHNQHHITNRR
jgi:hypothetical protein